MMWAKEISEGAHMGTTTHQGAPGGAGAPRWVHYCRMLLTRHYDQRPFDETVCDAIIANGGVKKLSKRCKMFMMEDASNTVQILVACAMQGIRFSSINRFR